MKKFGIVIATVIVMALTGCSSKESGAATTEALKIATEADAEVATTEEVKDAKKDEDTKKTTESVAQTTAVTPVQQTSSQQSSQTSQQNKPQTSQNQSTPVATEASSQPTPTTTQTPVPATTEVPAPVHQHTWATREEVVTAAWTETVEHPAVKHYISHCVCNYCGVDYGADIDAHQDQYQETDVEHAIAGWHGYDETVVDKPAWTETIEHPAVTKTVEYCTECGATK